MNILQKIEDLKGRSKDERVAVAGSIAVGVVIILFLGWAAFFIRSARPGPAGPATVEAAGTLLMQDQSPSLFDKSGVDQSAQVQLNSASTPPIY